MVKSFRQINFTDDSLQRFQDNVADVLNPLAKNPLMDGIVLEDISLLSSANPNLVSHKLGRKIIGYIVVSKSANAQIWDTQSTNTSKDLYLQLKCSADCRVSLFVF